MLKEMVIRMKICKTVKERIAKDVSFEVCDGYCCEQMKKYLEITPYGSEGLSYDTTKQRFTIGADYKPGSYEDYYHPVPIKYCPFCGERLE